MNIVTRRTQVAGEVRAEMARQRKSAVELASVLGVSYGTVQRRLSGQYAFTLDELHAIAEWLDVDPADLLRTKRDQVA